MSINGNSLKLRFNDEFKMFHLIFDIVGIITVQIIFSEFFILLLFIRSYFKVRIIALLLSNLEL